LGSVQTGLYINSVLPGALHQSVLLVYAWICECDPSNTVVTYIEHCFVRNTISWISLDKYSAVLVYYYYYYYVFGPLNSILMLFIVRITKKTPKDTLRWQNSVSFKCSSDWYI